MANFFEVINMHPCICQRAFSRKNGMHKKSSKSKKFNENTNKIKVKVFPFPISSVYTVTECSLQQFRRSLNRVFAL